MDDLETVRLRCNAKVNLYLRVLGRRPDGYHDIETVFHSISLHDTVTVTRMEEGFVLETDDPAIPRDESNLALRAARSLLSGRPGGVRIRIEKRIPVSAGLGGGSADAAGSLIGVNRLYGLGLEPKTLADRAARIGSDVPFMLGGGCALGRGRGEILTPLASLTPHTVVVVVPPLSISTPWAYETLKSGLTTRKDRGSILTDALETGAVESIKCLLFNDFESLVFERYPQVAEIKEGLLNDGAAGALMSGSGPAVFGIFDKDGDADRSTERFQDEGLSVYRSCFEESGVRIFS
jgi:4-diphosphocytidyl-2-C-methyl-D-erythritol kinase